MEELLRYLNITHGGRRRVALEEIEIAGEVIRAGEGIIVPNDIGNRDPEVFLEQLSFTHDGSVQGVHELPVAW